MFTSLFAILILTAWDQDGEAERPISKSIRVRHIMMIRGGILKVGGQPILVDVPSLTASESHDDVPQPGHLPRVITPKEPVLARENFDLILFADEGEYAARQRYLENILRVKVGVADRERWLTERQQAKLRLAGQGDIKRFFDGVQRKRERFEWERKDFFAGIAALRRLEPLKQSYSLFRKAI